MKVKCHQVSSIGAVRDHNEDFVVFYEPQDFAARQQVGCVAILADGVGGEGNGDVASRLAAETAVDVLMDTRPDTQTNELVRSIFDAASLKVFQRSQGNGR